MAEKNTAPVAEDNEVVIVKAKDFWTRNGKIISGVLVAVILLIGGYFGYKNFIQKPKEEKSANDMFKAESYFRMDSVKLALNGDGQNPGFLRIIDKYSGTDAANLASFYAGSCYIKLDDNQNAVKYLKKFSTDSKQVQARAYKLLGDAYADLGNSKEALDYYKKAAHHFEADETASAEALFLAAYLADRVIKDQKQAIELYKELKEKYPRTQQGNQADNYLAQLGVYNVN
jgi:predicted negative regulator of RcsB-dependent stress response